MGWINIFFLSMSKEDMKIRLKFEHLICPFFKTYLQHSKTLKRGQIWIFSLFSIYIYFLEFFCVDMPMKHKIKLTSPEGKNTWLLEKLSWRKNVKWKFSFVHGESPLVHLLHVESLSGIFQPVQNPSPVQVCLYRSLECIMVTNTCTCLDLWKMTWH